MLYGNETWYKMYTNTDLLLAANIIIVSSLLVYSRYGTEVSDITWCQIIDSLVYCIRLPSRLANFHQSTISVRVSTIDETPSSRSPDCSAMYVIGTSLQYKRHGLIGLYIVGGDITSLKP